MLIWLIDRKFRFGITLGTKIMYDLISYKDKNF